MRCFYHGKRRFHLVGILLSMGIVLAGVGAFSYGMDALSEKTRSEQKKSLEQAVWRSITQCYAIEGRYPENLEYLQEEYSLQYDSEQFFVDYQVTGANMLPDVTVIERQGDADGNTETRH